MATPPDAFLTEKNRRAQLFPNEKGKTGHRQGKKTHPRHGQNDVKESFQTTRVHQDVMIPEVNSPVPRR